MKIRLKLITYIILFISISTHSQDMPTAAPEIKTFVLDKTNLGQVENTVNLFAGQVNLPINLFTLPGRGGLNAGVSIVYNSNIGRQAEIWNLEAPTGFVGMGWSISIPKIIVDNKMTGSREDDEFYISDGGSFNRLICISINADGTRSYKSENYSSWLITYKSSNEKWLIVKEDGTKYTYGDDATNNGSAIEWIIYWGGWIGNSSNYSSSETKRQGLIWNLAKIENRWGDFITFKYKKVERYIKNTTGIRHTEASYISQITDVLGRSINFLDLPKEIREYQDPHTDVIETDNSDGTGNGTGDAYQERYERRYLSNIEIKDTDNSLLYSIQFVYEVPSDGNLTKRLLKSIIQKNKNGVAYPSIDFTYKTSGIKKGVLEKVTYPTGGEVIYHYDESGTNITDSNRHLSIYAPSGNYAEPYLWFGEDYVVVTWREQDSQGNHTTDGKNVQLRVYQWDGKWIDTGVNVQFTNIKSPPENQSLDEMNEFKIVTEKDFFAVLYKSSSTNQKEYKLLIERKDKSKRCSWTSYGWSSFYSINDYEMPQLISGERFVAYSDRRKKEIYTYIFDGDGWRQEIIDRGVQSNYKVTASNNFIISSDADADTFKFYYLNEMGEWQTIVPPSSCFFTSSFDKLKWYSSNSLAFAIRDGDEYLFSWDENYNIKPKVSYGGINDEDNMVFIVNNTMVSTVETYSGSGQSSTYAVYDGINWNITPDFYFYQYSLNGFGTNYGLRVTNGTSSPQIYIRKEFDPNLLSWGTDQTYLYYYTGNRFGEAVEAGNNYFTLWNQVYYRSPGGSWDQVEILSNDYNDIYAPSLSYGFPNFLIKENTENGNEASSDIYFLKNGDVLTPIRINDAIFTVRRTAYEDSNLKLLGLSTIVTCDNNYNHDFLDVTSLTLFRVIDENIDGIQTTHSVNMIEVNDKYTASRFISFDYGSTGAKFDPSGSIPLYGEVRVIKGSNTVSSKPFGYTEYLYYNGIPSTPPIEGGNEETNYVYLTGLPHTINNYNSQDNLVSSTKYSYKVNYLSVTNSNSKQVGISYYITQIKEQSQIDNITTLKTKSYYDPQNSTLLSAEEYVSSEGKNIRNEYKYLHNIGGSYTYAITQNLLSQVVQSKQLINGIPIESSIIKWTTAESVNYPKETYRWKRVGTSDYNFNSSNPDWELLTSSKIDAFGNVVQMKNEQGNILNSQIYGFNNTLPIATVSNADNTEIFADVFDDANLSKWTKNDIGSDGDTQWSVENDQLKLINYANATNGECDRISSTLDTEFHENIILEFDVTIANSNNWDLTIGLGGDSWDGGNGTTENAVWSSINNEEWKYNDGSWKTIKSGLVVGQTYHFTVVIKPPSNKTDFYVDGINCIKDGNYRVTSSGIKTIAFGNYGYGTTTTTWYIDNVRLYPDHSNVTLISYKPLVGKTLIIDKNDERMYYEYDDLDRLITTRDKRGNILNHTQYCFKLKEDGSEQQENFLTVTPQSISTGFNSCANNVTVSSNINWSISISSGDECWISTNQYSVSLL